MNRQWYAGKTDLSAKECYFCKHHQDGHCHKNAPLKDEGRLSWPRVDETNSCSEYKSRFDQHALSFRNSVEDLLRFIERNVDAEVLKNDEGVIRKARLLLHLYPLYIETENK